MTMTSQAPQPVQSLASKPSSLTEVRTWIVQFLESKHPEMRGTIHADMSFDSIGLDSLARVDMIGSMENQFGLKLDPTLAYDFVTPGALSSFVWGQIAGVPVDEKQLIGV
jgi:acyl carrier protein